MPVPDLEIRGGGWSSRPLDKGEGPVSKKTFFRPFGPQVGLKIRWGGGGPGPRTPPLDPPLIYPHVRESKTVLDSRFHSVDSVIQVLDSGFFVSGTWIPDSNR